MTDPGSAIESSPDVGATHPFSDRLRAATMNEHRRAEASPFMRALLKGDLNREAVIALVGQLRHVYAALETPRQALRSDPVFAVFDDRRLDRLPALDADLAQLDGRRPAEPLPATDQYVARIHAAASDTPAFLAHHYLRYLGDLSGGQIVARRLRRHYQVPEAALSFYRFDGLGDLVAFKDSYRRNLNRMLPSSDAQRTFIEEAATGYRLNRALFDQLSSLPPAVASSSAVAPSPAASGPAEAGDVVS